MKMRGLLTLGLLIACSCEANSEQFGGGGGGGFGGEGGGGGTGASAGFGGGGECETPADCGYNTVDMVWFCNDGWCDHGDNPWGLCPDGPPCQDDEFCYFDPILSDPPEDGGLCVPNRCAVGGDCILDDGGIIYIETDPVEFCRGACIRTGGSGLAECLAACEPE